MRRRPVGAPTRTAALAIACATALAVTVGTARAQSARDKAPIDLTGQWVTVITEDWAWRMQTPPKGDYASVPLNEAGVRAADTWDPSLDGSCRAFGAPALLRQPTRVRIRWSDENTLVLTTDNGRQTRRLRFEPADPGAPSLQGHSVARWLTPEESAEDTRWASLEVVTTGLTAGWLRPNGVPYSDDAALTEYFDAFAVGDEAWFAVTTIVDDPAYLTEPFVISSNFKRERDRDLWRPEACRP